MNGKNQKNTAKKQPLYALIPAKGKSSALPGKNMKPLLGKPMLFYSINAAKKTPGMKAIYVSTDDKKIGTYSEKNGVIYVKRPKALAGKLTPMKDVIIHFLKTAKIPKNSIIVLLQPTSPLRTSIDIEKSYALLCKSKSADSVISVFNVENINPHKLYIKNGLFIQKAFSGKTVTARQLLPNFYCTNGAIYMFKVKSFLKNSHKSKDPWGKRIPYFMPKWRSVDIDTIQDFQLAELLMKNPGKVKNPYLQ